MNAPEWLTRRDGSVRPYLNDATWLVLLSGHPQYRLFGTPAEGGYTCAITQTNNGHRLDGGKKYATIGTALEGGLEELKERLGW